MIPTTEQADAYHELRGNAGWSALTFDQKNAALAKADDYITAFYLPLISDIEIVNPRLIAAYSLLALELQTNPTALKVEQSLKAKEVTSGDDSVKTTYQDADKAPVTDPYPLVTAMIAPLRANQTANGVTFGVMI